MSNHFEMITKKDLIKRNFHGIDVISTLVKSVQFLSFFIIIIIFFFLGGGGGGAIIILQ